MAGYSEVDLQEELAEVRAAIKKCLTAQEYTAGAQIGLKRADLRALQDREKWLLNALASLGGGTINLAQCRSRT